MTSQTLYHVQARTVWRQKKHMDLISMRFEPLPHRFGLMKWPVIADQPNLSASISGYQSYQKCKKVLTVFSLGYSVGDLVTLDCLSLTLFDDKKCEQHWPQEAGFFGLHFYW